MKLGDEVVVEFGPKQGLVGKVFWLGKDHVEHRVGIKEVSGTTHFLNKWDVRPASSDPGDPDDSWGCHTEELGWEPGDS